MDSQWQDNTAWNKSEKLIQQGEKVFIWPEKFGKKYKDFNDICISNDLDQISPEFIKKHSFSGKSAELRFNLITKNPLPN